MPEMTQTAEMCAWDGIPLTCADVDGWHWLLEPYSWSKPEPVYWCADTKVWRGKGRAVEASRTKVRYLQPCPVPAV